MSQRFSRILSTALLLACSCLAHAQGGVTTGSPIAINQSGVPLASLTVSVCTNATCSALATIYTDSTLSTACSGTAGTQPLNNVSAPSVGSGCSNPGLSDSVGNVVAYSNSGMYWCQYSGSIIPTKILPCPILGPNSSSSPGTPVGTLQGNCLGAFCGVPHSTFNSSTGDITPGANVYIAGPRPWIDVVTLGADPTGTSDSTSAFTTADTNCAGGTVLVPPGTYKLSTWTPTTSCNFATNGQFGSVHLVRNSSTTVTNRQAGWVVIEASNFSINGFWFDGNVSSFGGNCVLIEGPITDVRIMYNLINNCDGSGLTLTATAVGGIGPSRVDIAFNKIAGGTNAQAQGAIYGEDTLDTVNIHDNPLIDGTNLVNGSTINLLSAGLTTTFNSITIANNPKILVPASGGSWGVQLGGFNAFAVIAPRVENNGFELTGTNAGFISIPIAISGKIIAGNHMNTHYVDLMRCGATIASACANDGVSNSTSTWTSASGSFTAADSGKTLRYACGGTNYTTLVTFSNSTTLTLTTAAVCTGSSESWYLFGYSATLYGIEGGGSTGTIILGNTLYFEGSQQATCIGLDGSSYTVVEGNECQGMSENSGQGIGMIAGTAPQTIASLSQSINNVTVSTSGALNATWQPSTTIATTNCQLNTCRSGTDGTTAASTTFTSATAAFTSADVNRFINIYGCIATSGPNPSGMSLNSIASVTNGTTVTLAFACTQVQTASATWQIVTSPQLFTTTIINQGYSRSGGTFTFIDATTGVTCSSNCGGIIQTVSHNLIKGNTVQLPTALASSGNVFAYVLKTQTTNAEYAYGNTFEGNKAVATGGQGGGQFCFSQTGGVPLIDQTEWKQNTCLNANNGFNINNGQNVRLIGNELINVGTAWSGSSLPGENTDFVDTIGASQLSGTGFGTSPLVSPNHFSCATCNTTTRALYIVVGSTPAASTGSIGNLSPAAPNGWSCTPLTDQTRTGISIRQTASTTNSITFTFDSAATAGDILVGSCSPY